MGITTAIIGGTALAGGAYLGSEASKDATKAQTESAKKATDIELEQYQQTREDLMPWLETGELALKDLWKLIQQGPGEFTESPGYQFRLGEGEKGINRAASAKGMRLSGATLKDLLSYNQEYASSEYDKFLSRYYQKLNPLQSLAGVGMSTGANVGQLGAGATQNIADNTLAGGQAKASGYINQANIMSNLLQQGAMLGMNI